MPEVEEPCCMKNLSRLRWETLNPLLSVRQAEISPCVKTMGEAESEVNHTSFENITEWKDF